MAGRGRRDETDDGNGSVTPSRAVSWRTPLSYQYRHVPYDEIAAFEKEGWELRSKSDEGDFYMRKPM